MYNTLNSRAVLSKSQLFEYEFKRLYIWGVSL